MLLLVVVVLVGAGYGYFRYQWSKVHSAPCATCVAAVNGAPYNVLLIGSDSRAGESAAQAQQFGTAAQAGGQRSDTIKIVHVDPQKGTASTLSIPRDTFVTLSGIPASTGLSSENKINAAFNNGPDSLIKTIESTFGIPISHYVVINFFGVEDAVNALGGINLDFPYEARDRDCDPNTGICNNNSGLDITRTGCQTLSGFEALALSRSRFYQYYDPRNGWTYDPTGDLGRIERQNLVISATLNKAKGTYNPIRLNALFGSVAKDLSKDNGLTFNDLFDLAERYKAFSGSDLQTYTLPTSGATSSTAGAVEVVEPQAAAQTIAEFLAGSPQTTITTPPLDAYGSPLDMPAITTTTAPPTTAAPATSKPVHAPTPTTAPGTTSGTSYDPTPC